MVTVNLCLSYFRPILMMVYVSIYDGHKKYARIIVLLVSGYNN